MSGYKYGATVLTPRAMRTRIKILENELARKSSIVAEQTQELRQLRQENSDLRANGASGPGIQHGTTYGYARHYALGQKPCDWCREVYNNQRRERERARGGRGKK